MQMRSLDRHLNPPGHSKPSQLYLYSPKLTFLFVAEKYNLTILDYDKKKNSPQNGHKKGRNRRKNNCAGISLADRLGDVVCREQKEVVKL